MRYRNILIVRTDRIGDVVLTTPAIKALRRAYPAARISILVAEQLRDLVDGNPYLDDVMTDDRQGRHKGPLGFLRLVGDLRARRFDLAVIFHTKRRYNLACCLAGIPCRLGYKNEKWGGLLTLPLKDTRSTGQKHEAEYCIDVLRAIGVEGGDLDMFVPLQKEAEAWALEWMKENNLQSQGFIAVHPGASDPAKCWPAAGFAAVMDRLSDNLGFKIVLIGSAQTAAAAEDILSQAQRQSMFLNMTGKTSLAQTVSLLRRSSLLVSNDSGPVHLAAALGVSVISLFLRDHPGVNAGRWRPLGPKGFVLQFAPLLDGRTVPAEAEKVTNLAVRIFRENRQYEIF